MVPSTMEIEKNNNRLRDSKVQTILDIQHSKVVALKKK